MRRPWLGRTTGAFHLSTTRPILIASVAGLMSLGVSSPAWPSDVTGEVKAAFKAGGEAKLDRVANFDHQVTGVAATEDGRVFVNFPRWSEDAPVSVAEIKDGKPVPYPDAEWNRYRNAAPLSPAAPSGSGMGAVSHLYQAPAPVRRQESVDDGTSRSLAIVKVGNVFRAYTQVDLQILLNILGITHGALQVLPSCSLVGVDSNDQSNPDDATRSQAQSAGLRAPGRTGSRFGTGILLDWRRPSFQR